MATGFIWIMGASVLGFSISAIFSRWLKLKRDLYLIIYVPIVAAYFYAFLKTNNLNVVDHLQYNWYWGLAGALIASVFVIKNVLSQPSSERHKGFALLSDIAWPGFAYGLIDSLLMSVLPILAVRMTFNESGLTGVWAGRIVPGVIALAASCIVTAIYHWGYSEFRGKRVIWPLIGNAVLSVAYLLTLNPLAAVLPHIGMHITAMIHGRETTGQVPPHYDNL